MQLGDRVRPSREDKLPFSSGSSEHSLPIISIRLCVIQTKLLTGFGLATIPFMYFLDMEAVIPSSRKQVYKCSEKRMNWLLNTSLDLGVNYSLSQQIYKLSLFPSASQVSQKNLSLHFPYIFLNNQPSGSIAILSTVSVMPEAKYSITQSK